MKYFEASYLRVFDEVQAYTYLYFLLGTNGAELF